MNKENIIEELRKSSKEVSDASNVYIEILLKNKKIVNDIYEESHLIMSEKEFQDIFKDEYKQAINLIEKIIKMFCHDY